ncbi:NAD-dependent protein deacylase sirtuin-5, mitochondrial [Blomia tropicalis]|nr:NAD-dependent protein deacylase sirtuin-5, mitochondrial [Blomia tropicalis]
MKCGCSLFFRLAYNHLLQNLMGPKRNYSSDVAKFRKIFDQSQRVVALTGAGISAESGVPTFRGDGGLWRQHQATDLANPEAFERDPSLVWQFYEYRRQLVATKSPNNAHLTLAKLQKKVHPTELVRQEKYLYIVTQNVDELHSRAGSRAVIELHGSMFKTRCTGCKKVKENYNNPITPALANITEFDEKKIPRDQLPHCELCNQLLRPHVVWFNESLNPRDFEFVVELINECDLLLVIGTSSLVHPANMFAPNVARRGGTVAEFNLEPTTKLKKSFFFPGPCGESLPKIFPDA